MSARILRDIPALDRDSLLYIAGLFDGEGCIRICRSKKHKGDDKWCYTPDVKIVLTHEKAIAFIAEKLARPYWHRAHQRSNCKDGYGLQISDVRGVIAFIEQIAPFLIVKKEAAETVLRFCRSRTQQRKTKYNIGYTEEEITLSSTLSILNRKGLHSEAVI